MARLNRRRKPIGQGGITPSSTRWQRLMWGEVSIGADGPDFESESEERAAWFANRRELMAECSPGERPAAYFRFELKQTPPARWFDQIQVLLARQLFDEAEAEQIEDDFELLNSTQAESLCAAFDRRETARDASPELARQFDVAAAWHAYRGHPELAQRYALRAAVVRSVLEPQAA